jgi:preprotein translocase subunit SecA
MPSTLAERREPSGFSRRSFASIHRAACAGSANESHPFGAKVDGNWLSTVTASRFNMRDFKKLQPRIRRVATKISQLSTSQLQSAANDLREAFHTQSADGESLLVEGFALSFEAIRRSIGIELFDVQLMAAAGLAKNVAVEMETGEGKTLAAAPAAMLGALRGQAVHIATPNAYLAERDYRLLCPAFETLGISVGHLPERDASETQKRQAYECEVTYGTGYEFGFDYLRDQLAGRSAVRKPLGESLLGRLYGVDEVDQKLQRGHMVTIVDEIDNVLLDDAGSPLILCQGATTSAEDSDACLLARRTISLLLGNEHYRISNDGAVQLTSHGVAAIYDESVPIPANQLRRPWTEYIEQALRAEFLFHRDANYLVVDGEIRIVDASTGRIFSDRTWADGLHQAIEAKEGLKVSNERSALAQVTRQRYFRLYSHLCGMTGTAVGCETEFRDVYALSVLKVPRRIPCQRTIFPMRTFADDSAKWAAIVTETMTQHRSGRPVLIGTRTIVQSERLADLLVRQNLPFQLLNGKQDAEEADVISNAGRHGSITIATNLAGRGTDIRLDATAKQRGGLHVIVSEPYELIRSERQLIGRCARQGDPGSARKFVSANDAFIQDYGRWLVRPMLRCADANGEVPVELSRKIRGIQRFVERKQAAARMSLMRRDLARDSLLSPVA